MNAERPTTIYLKDYKKPDFSFVKTELQINLDFKHTKVVATHLVNKENPSANSLKLDYELMDIESVSINGENLDRNQYAVTDNYLVIDNPADEFELTIQNTINPSINTVLSGLYQSNDMLSTQCEAEGYRRITPAQDRPDSLTVYTVKLTADKQDFPVLLCNGNLSSSTDNGDGTHSTIWDDPFPKPTYLFAIVAGKLESMEDQFKTRSGRMVSLKFYARGQDISKCAHAMTALKHSMRWDEKVYGREYDLDLFNVVAVDDFNMGAMENKSLNIFNSKYVLANSSMATDIDFTNVESVIAHEYFHNWSGNRVTCRDWFQLSLKEGFTVFRDQEFSADRGSRGVKRIGDVNILRTHQFKEDASPIAHPVRPESYQEINNFYTATIYNKGAEVFRMVRTIVGPETFRKGSDLYFTRHDGEAVTTDDFIKAMEDVSNINLTQFKNWYTQAGTPELHFSFEYQKEQQRFIISVTQQCPNTPGQRDKKPFVIPVQTALFDAQGNKLALDSASTERLMLVDQYQQDFIFENISSRPIPSLLRNFSSPVKINSTLEKNELLTLLAYDDDPFNRWESGQRLYLQQILDNIENLKSGKPVFIDPALSKVFNRLLVSASDDAAFLAKVLTLPEASYIAEFTNPIDPQRVEQARNALRLQLCKDNMDALMQTINSCEASNTGKPITAEMEARALRDVCLDYLSILDNPACREWSKTLLKQSKCMTDASTAISLIARSHRADRQTLLNQFYQTWKAEPLVIDKWLRAQSTVASPTTLERVKNLVNHTGFDRKNPNKVYALILGFSHANPAYFHAGDGSGYDFVSQWVKILDPINPQVAAKLVSALNGWQKYQPNLSAQMQAKLKEISEMSHLSNDVREIVVKNLD